MYSEQSKKEFNEPKYKTPLEVYKIIFLDMCKHKQLVNVQTSQQYNTLQKKSDTNLIRYETNNYICFIVYFATHWRISKRLRSKS